MAQSQPPSRRGRGQKLLEKEEGGWSGADEAGRCHLASWQCLAQCSAGGSGLGSLWPPSASHLCLEDAGCLAGL